MGIHINYKVSSINSADIGFGNEEDGRGKGSVPRLTRMANYLLLPAFGGRTEDLLMFGLNGKEKKT